jgi:hypothetical protein
MQKPDLHNAKSEVRNTPKQDLRSGKMDVRNRKLPFVHVGGKV